MRPGELLRAWVDEAIGQKGLWLGKNVGVKMDSVVVVENLKKMCFFG